MYCMREWAKIKDSRSASVKPCQMSELHTEANKVFLSSQDVSESHIYVCVHVHMHVDFAFGLFVVFFFTLLIVYCSM